MVATRNSTQFYTWNGYRCAYEMQRSSESRGTPLLLIHPIGVGLSRHFWQRFCQQWQQSNCPNPIYNPDLLGCGDSEMPRIAYTPKDWANQLQYFIETVIQVPVIVVVQGALFPVAIDLALHASNWVRGSILAGPPALPVMAKEGNPNGQKLIWNLFFDTPLGNGFYRYARREKFLRSFSERQLFAQPEDVDRPWLEMLQAGAANPDSRYAVFSFLAGFWRRDYREEMSRISQPTLVVIGEAASSISREGKQDNADRRQDDYRRTLPNGETVVIEGRNVLPYETTNKFVDAIVPFVTRLG